MTRWIAESIAEARGWTFPADDELRWFFEERVARGERELAARRKAELDWEDQPRPTHRIFAPEMFERDRQNASLPKRSPVPIMEVFEGYKGEQEPTPKTIKKWKVALRSLIEYLGHDDASRVTTDDIIQWKNALLAPAEDGQRQRGQATVRNGYIGAVKPVFGWAEKNKLITSNPVAGVSVRVPRRVRTREERGFTDAEAKIVLTAATAINWQAHGSFKAFACRWLPWLCAYTGARIGEMAQLRRDDVGQNEQGIWYVKITPEAGSTKGGYARKVALHPHLLEQGFIRAIEGRSGPLFYDPQRKRAGSDGNPQYGKVGQRVAKWVRSLGVTDKELQPNHGWRHRFITIARDIQMDPDARQAMVGHSARTEHQDYGNTLIRTSHRWLRKFPRYNIDRLEAS
jgi:integrase